MCVHFQSIDINRKKLNNTNFVSRGTRDHFVKVDRPSPTHSFLTDGTEETNNNDFNARAIHEFGNFKMETEFSTLSIKSLYLIVW